ncbi:hypothetical protein E1267_11295 [Nonomuraea longispora]|uniref:Uncharacterized protein n=1 Tax=Nonomuraea longispora TaxID=1848320 RepID=A0A4R4NJY1_9ACTN|nr:hypothetical protein [Nonomuraea longispora]TDC08053.1 hypothetical protein E1267_11295 [Nonomuraea longispora]
MTNPPKVHAFRLGEIEMVAISQEDYDQLLGTRRRMGAQGNRLRGLRTQLDLAQDRLERISELVRTGHTADNGCDSDCLKCAIVALLVDPSHTVEDA